MMSVIISTAYATGKDPSDHLLWTEMIRLVREIIVSYDVELAKVVLERPYRASYNNSADENNVLLIELLHIDKPWSYGMMF